MAVRTCGPSAASRLSSSHCGGRQRRAVRPGDRAARSEVQPGGEGQALPPLERDERALLDGLRQQREGAQRDAELQQPESGAPQVELRPEAQADLCTPRARLPGHCVRVRGCGKGAEVGVVAGVGRRTEAEGEEVRHAQADDEGAELVPIDEC